MLHAGEKPLVYTDQPPNSVFASTEVPALEQQVCESREHHSVELGLWVGAAIFVVLTLRTIADK